MDAILNETVIKTKNGSYNLQEIKEEYLDHQIVQALIEKILELQKYIHDSKKENVLRK